MVPNDNEVFIVEREKIGFVEPTMLRYVSSQNVVSSRETSGCKGLTNRDEHQPPGAKQTDAISDAGLYLEIKSNEPTKLLVI